MRPRERSNLRWEDNIKVYVVCSENHIKTINVNTELLNVKGCGIVVSDLKRVN